MTDLVFQEIHLDPGVDTPLVCLRVHSNDFVDPGHRGAKLAQWLNEWHTDAWHKTCEAVDCLLEEGMISFSDDGELRAII
tara:strand:+ start:616 stop:855 length:240 start_codon:yes stop_codon:yes gene_type:complete